MQTTQTDRESNTSTLPRKDIESLTENLKARHSVLTTEVKEIVQKEIVEFKKDLKHDMRGQYQDTKLMLQTAIEDQSELSLKKITFYFQDFRREVRKEMKQFSWPSVAMISISLLVNLVVLIKIW